MGDQVMPALAMELVPGDVAFSRVHPIWTSSGLAARLPSPAHATPLPPPSSRATAGRCSPPMPPGSCCLPQESPAADGGGMRAAGDAAMGALCCGSRQPPTDFCAGQRRGKVVIRVKIFL
ncbi:hypothetical protein PVAP13_9NG238500 [Panicum virgatum]|uniref:Uncharacterized protein n=1 Tax=Panicum virgatum TaxID=38727 RepID=A0A8T0MKS6_PANVG|nr:hypothetical protein PVAP13_9NG238500 [Panicum virgatum]